MKKPKFIKSKKKAYQLLEDDRIKVGGRMYQIDRIAPSYATNSKLNIGCHLDGGDTHYERLALFCDPAHKFTIYNQK